MGYAGFFPESSKVLLIQNCTRIAGIQAFKNPIHPFNWGAGIIGDWALMKGI
jgi:hypothetical protein